MFDLFSTETIATVLGLIAIVGAIGYRTWLKRTALNRLAKELGMALTLEGSSKAISGVYSSFPVKMLWGTNFEDKVKTTDIKMTMRPCGFKLTVTKENVLSKVGDVDQLEDITANNDSFDNEFAIRCGSVEKAKAVMTPAMCVKFLAIEKKLREGESFIVDNDRVTFTKPEKHITGIKDIRSLLDIMASLAQSIQDTQVIGGVKPKPPSAPAAPAAPMPPSAPAPPQAP